MTGKMFNKMCAIGMTVVGINLAVNVNLLATVTYKTIALTSTPAPGTSDGAEYLSFSTPVLNNSGELVFNASLQTGSGAPVTLTNDVALFGPTATGLSLIVRENDPAPGVTDGAEFASMGDPSLNDLGDVVFEASLRTGSGPIVTTDNFRSVYAIQNSTLNLVARTDSPAPDTTDNVEFHVLDFVTISDASDITFKTLLRKEDNTTLFSGAEAIYQMSPSGLSLIAREDGPAPDTVGGVKIDRFGGTQIDRLGSPPFRLNENGNITFSATLYSGDVTPSNNEALFGLTDDGLKILVRKGEPAPGFTDSTTLIGVGNPLLNNNGAVAYHALLPNSEASTNPLQDPSDEAVFGQTASGLGLIARENNPAPGTNDAEFDRFFGLIINDANEAAFKTYLRNIDDTTDPHTDQALFAHTASGLKLIARENDIAPGSTDSARFNGFDDPTLNENGDIVFHAYLRNGTTETGDLTLRGLYAYHKATDSLIKIIQDGDLLDVNNDPLIEDFKTVNTFSFAADTAFNNAGQVSLQIRFSDQSQGVFVATIPEPTSLMLLATGLACVFYRPV